MIRRIGIIVGFGGTTSGLIGSLWYLLFPTIDANIGAGALVVSGVPLATLGIAMCILSLYFGNPTSTTKPSQSVR